jgi:predicted transcriptional regulator
MPTANELLRMCARTGVDARAAFARFHASAPPDPSDPTSLAAWLEGLRGSTSIVELGTRVGCSRSTVSRWLSGRAKPRVHEFLALVESMTGRACDLVAELVPIQRVPALEAAHVARSAARRLAHEEPWTEAILRVLESRPYRVGSVAAQLNLDLATERRCMEKLLLGGIVTRVEDEYEVVGELTVDTRAVPQLKAHWSAVAHARLAEPLDDDVFSYNVLSVAAEDLDAIRERLRATYREIRAIVSNSRGTERVALVNLQLLHWPSPRDP